MTKKSCFKERGKRERAPSSYDPPPQEWRGSKKKNPKFRKEERGKRKCNYKENKKKAADLKARERRRSGVSQAV